MGDRKADTRSSAAGFLGVEAAIVQGAFAAADAGRPRGSRLAAECFAELGGGPRRSRA